MKNALYVFLAGLFMLVCNACADQHDTNTSSHKPNVIYILADDLGYGDIGCYNANGKIPTPHLDEMAMNGLMFTDAHTSSSVCTPTRYGILTGRYNWRSQLKNGVLGGYSKSLIKQERTTVAEMLRKQGYTTAYIGKWHLGWDWKMNSVKQNINNLHAIQDVDYTAPIANGPDTHGFDYSYGFCGSLDMPPYVWVENGMPTKVPFNVTRCVDEKGFWRPGPTGDDFSHTSILQDVCDKAVQYITAQSGKEKPFFLYLPLPAPHTPILPTTEFLGKSNTNMYGDFVMQVDEVVHQIREALKKQGISENTLLVFTSDNGCSPKADFEELAKVKHDPSYSFRGMKSDIYEGGHRVPFIIEWPGRGLKNAKADQTICTTDFFATCAELTDYHLKDNEGEDSYSMLPLITGSDKAEIREYTIHHSINGNFAIRQGDWKLCVCPGSGGWSYPSNKDIKTNKLELPPMQIYNLRNDIAEEKNLIHEHPEKATELKAALKKIILDGRSTPGAKQSNEGMDKWWQIKNIVN
ncbi:MAG: arylsulfatase [Bacteroidales bacterium]|nr:arylsulfatase [Bacteroidales bacterium]